MYRQWSYLMLFFCLALAACTGQKDDVPATAEATSTIQVAIATDDFVAGTPRIPFFLYDGSQRVSTAQTVTLTAFDLSQDPPEPGWTGTATGYNDYEVPYWVAYPAVPKACFWGLAAAITLADGKIAQAQFTIEVKEESQSPVVGDMALPSENRTLATEPDISKLSSGNEPNPAFYQVTVKEALDSERPSVIVFSTPAFCQTAICAPVLNSVETVYESLGDEVNFIHLEIYKQFNPELILADEMTEWQLATEPWTYVLDDTGRVAARLGGPVSALGLTAVLEPLLP